MNVTILNVTLTTATGKNNKPYQVADIAFKNNTFQGKVEGKKITSYSQPAFGILSVAQPGQTFDIVVEKKNGFNEWVQVQQAAPGAVPNVPATVGAVGGAQQNAAARQGTASPRSNYETPEERAQRQVYIINQSSLTAAVSTLSVGAKSLKPEDVMALAERYRDFVLGTKDKGATGFDDLPNFDMGEPNVE